SSRLSRTSSLQRGFDLADLNLAVKALGALFDDAQLFVERAEEPALGEVSQRPHEDRKVVFLVVREERAARDGAQVEAARHLGQRTARHLAAKAAVVREV